MDNLNKLVESLARAVVVIGWEDFIPTYAFRNLCHHRGLGFEKVPDLLAAFVARFPAWQEASNGKCADLTYLASAHSKMAWAAFVAQVRREEGLSDV